MARFLIRRVLQGLLVMFLMTITVFYLFFVGPGPKSVARLLAGRQAKPQQVAEVSRRLGLNKPVLVQYKDFVWNALHGNLGHDFINDVPVTHEIAQAFPITLSLVIGAAIIWLTIGLVTGIVSAVRTRSVWDRAFTTFALFFYSTATFVLGLLFVWLLFGRLTAVGLPIFPAPDSYTSITQNPLTWMHDLLLPWLTIALVSAATYTRLTRGSMLDVFGEDYIRTARSKGMSERRLIFRHNLRAAMTPIVTQFGLDVGVLLGGAIVTEKIFALPGLGWTAVNAINAQNLPVVIGVVLVASAGVIVSNILVDIGYAVLDPRVRLH